MASTPKYQVGRRTRWNRAHDIRMTDHAAYERWDERTPADAVAPETAFEAGEWVDHPELFGAGDLNRVRLYNADEWGAVLLCKGGSIRTVYRVRAIKHAGVRAYCRAHGRHDGGEAA